jgi:hypothetical protein
MFCEWNRGFSRFGQLLSPAKASIPEIEAALVVGVLIWYRSLRKK